MKNSILQKPITDLISPTFKNRRINPYFDEDRYFANFVCKLLKQNTVSKYENLAMSVVTFVSIVAGKVGLNFNSILQSYAENKLGEKIELQDDDEDKEEEMFTRYRKRRGCPEMRSISEACDTFSNALEISPTAFLGGFFAECSSRLIEIFTAAYELNEFAPISERMEFLQEFASLSDDEVEFLIFKMMMSNFPSLGEAWHNSTKLQRFNFLKEVLGINPNVYASLEAEVGSLKKFNIIDEDTFAEDSEINQKVDLYLRGYLDSFSQSFASELEIEESFPIQSFDLPRESVKILLGLLKSKKPCKILLYGKPGTGKTEFSKALIRATGKKMLLPKIDTTTKEPQKLKSLLRADFMSQKTGNIAVFDECDNFLNTIGFGDKSEINTTLDKMSGKSIWICNYTHYINPSTRRRFSYSMKFDGITKGNTHAVLHSALCDCDFGNYISEDKVAKIAKTYSLSLAEISQAVRNTDSIFEHPEDPEKILRVIENFAQSQSILNGDMKFKRRSAESNKSFCLSDNRFMQDTRFDFRALNIDFDYEKLLLAMQNYKDAFLADEVNTSMNLIFAGAPGTGKTELARHIANELDLPIIVKSLSSLLGKYVGETEKNIAAAFDEAEEQKGVLVIDEADALFNDRQKARQPWEVTMTNEMLTQIERFRGIFICTTNLFDNFDQAAMRRFQKKITFGYLKEEAREILFKRYLCKEGEDIEEETLLELKDMEFLTAGDFKNVATQDFFNPTASSQTELIELLKKEISFKKEAKPASRMGFI